MALTLRKEWLHYRTWNGCLFSPYLERMQTRYDLISRLLFAKRVQTKLGVVLNYGIDQVVMPNYDLLVGYGHNWILRLKSWGNYDAYSGAIVLGATILAFYMYLLCCHDWPIYPSSLYLVISQYISLPCVLSLAIDHSLVVTCSLGVITPTQTTSFWVRTYSWLWVLSSNRVKL
jgi:hypothetical protein